VQGIERVNIFGVRHLSPSASFHLLQLLKQKKPKCVLIEGPSDATEVMDDLILKGVKLPVAILAYTTELPVNTVLYPIAEYAPEYQAIKWAKKANAEVRFIDLPSNVLLSLEQHYKRNAHKENKKTPTDEADKTQDIALDHFQMVNTIYDEVARLDGAVNFDDYFERNFEHNINEGSFNTIMKLESSELRQLLEPSEMEAAPIYSARNLIREAYMAMQIQEAIKKGYKPEEILVVTGAYHANQLLHTAPMTKEEYNKLPKKASKLTLMPYSFYRLSSRTGYGAGNTAPAYFQLMWKCMTKNRLEDLPVEYMSRLGRHMRKEGNYCSTASVIEAVRLARSLAYLKEGSQPTLEDLHAAAIACIGHGDASELATAFAMSDVGTAFGALPEGVSQTPIQDDFNRELKRLKLEKYKTTVAEELTLDLRENIRVKSKEAAFIDLNRSTFLHRLAFLGVKFAKEQHARQDGASWREIWTLQWTPEVEVQVIESVIKGETVELAAAFILMERLEACTDVGEAANLVKTAYICELADGTSITTLQKLTTETGDFVKSANACDTLSRLVQYSDIRRFDKEPLETILQQLFLRASLLLVDCSGCDNKAAAEVASAIRAMHRVSQESYDIINTHEDTYERAWVRELRNLATRDDKNPMLSGLCFAILIEKNLMDEDFCTKEVSRRLSPGTPADIGAGWFEGMSGLNRYALLSRVSLWQALDDYVQSLDDDEFKRSVVYMRRAFSSFGAKGKSDVAELLARLWNIDVQDAAILLQAPLNEEEEGALATLDDFDFDI